MIIENRDTDFQKINEYKKRLEWRQTFPPSGNSLGFF